LKVKGPSNDERLPASKRWPAAGGSGIMDGSGDERRLGVR
jgi:hypothetical protein